MVIMKENSWAHLGKRLSVVSGMILHKTVAATASGVTNGRFVRGRGQARGNIKSFSYSCYLLPSATEAGALLELLSWLQDLVTLNSEMVW